MRRNSKSKSRPKSKTNIKSSIKSKPKSKSNSKPRKGDSKNKGKPIEEAEPQDHLIEKAKLLAYKSSKQLQILEEIYNKIIVQPEENFKHIETMFTLVKVTNLQVVSTTLRTLADTFVKIAPLQAINMNEIEERMQVKIKKEEYKVLKFEKNLVCQYERFIKMLRQIHLKTKPENFQQDQQIYVEFKKCLLECIIKCYRALWNFNMAKELNDLLMKFIRYQECRKFIKEMLSEKNIATTEVKQRIVGAIGRFMARQQQKQLPKDIIQIINCTYIDTRFLKKEQETLDFKKKQMKKKLYRQQAIEFAKQKEKRNIDKDALENKRKKKEEKVKEKLKVKKQIAEEFAQGQATLSNKQIIHQNSNVLQELFYIYFKIMVQKIKSPLLRDALDGILKYVHLINIDLTKSLIQHLNVSAIVYRDLWRQNNTHELMQARLLIVFAGQSIINGPLSVYNMDDFQMITHLYKIMKDLNSSDNKKKQKLNQEIYRLICVNFEQAFIKRRQLSQQIVGSFAREIAILISQQPGPKLYLLELLRLFAYRYQKITRMFQDDNEGYGINSFNPNCQDPQCSNAIYTEIISYLKNVRSDYSAGYQQEIQTNVARLIKQHYQQRDLKTTLQNILEQEMEGGFF